MRNSEPDRVLSAGQHKVRGFFQAEPELYLFRPDNHFLPLWITHLGTADGRPVTLGWRVQVQIADVRRLWEGWLRHQQSEWIAVPAELVSARLADSAQLLVQRYSLDDLRGDGEVRRQVAGKLNLLIKEQLGALGLELAGPVDPQLLRFLSEADVVATARERAALRRTLEDERLDAELNRLNNVEALADRLQTAAFAAGNPISAVTAQELAQQTLGVTGRTTAVALDQVLAAPPPQPTPAAPAPLPPVEHRGQQHVFRRLSLIVLIASLLAAMTLATIALMRPELMATETQRNQLAGVVGIAILGVLSAWVIDQMIRWEAQRSAERLLLEANLETTEVSDSRLEARHILTLVSAMAGIAVTAAALWMPQHLNWVHVVATGIGLITAALAIRIDWLHNINRADQVTANAQRRIASARLNAVQRQRTHTKLQATMSAELEIVRQRLDESAGVAYQRLDDRSLNRRLRGLETSVKQQIRQVRALEQAVNRAQRRRVGGRGRTHGPLAGNGSAGRQPDCAVSGVDATVEYA